MWRRYSLPTPEYFFLCLLRRRALHGVSLVLRGWARSFALVRRNGAFGVWISQSTLVLLFKVAQHGTGKHMTFFFLFLLVLSCSHLDGSLAFRSGAQI